MAEVAPEADEAVEGVTAVWVVRHTKSDDRLRVRIHEVIADTAHDLGVDPGLVRTGSRPTFRHSPNTSQPWARATPSSAVST